MTKTIKDPQTGQFLKTFKANGNKYLRVEYEKLNIERFELWQKFTFPVGFGISFQEQFNSLQKIREMLDGCIRGEFSFGDLAAYVKEAQNAIRFDTNSRHDAALYMCTLFLVREGEDLTTWSEAEADAKIEDWSKEGIAAEDFLIFALNMVPSFKQAYEGLLEKADGLQKKSILGAGGLQETAQSGN